MLSFDGTQNAHKHQFSPYTDNGGTSLAIAGPDFCVVASDTRQSEGYLINARFAPKTYPLTAKAVLATNGYYADGRQMAKELLTNIRMYRYQHDEQMSTRSAAQLASTILYGRRFFPYYTFNIIGGLDEEGRGAVYSFDPVGSFERERYRAGGSAAALIQPFLDCQVGRKNQLGAPEELTLAQAVRIAKDAFSSAAERDIYTGDFVQIWIINAAGMASEQYAIRKD